ncbi:MULTISPECIES: hypothetical protein [Pseudoalteromonas]|uniref:hypothetical protein n=1 Tax=Pseudoalteromonas TaxID=53246 RepID=UPI0002E9B793|nr:MULTISPECIES: hypothetical protein [Pseudoalteromonas]MDP4489577.1 hypothetical protein [Pseudoalteromonas piscicida]
MKPLLKKSNLKNLSDEGILKAKETKKVGGGDKNCKKTSDIEIPPIVDPRTNYENCQG